MMAAIGPRDLALGLALAAIAAAASVGGWCRTSSAAGWPCSAGTASPSPAS